MVKKTLFKYSSVLMSVVLIASTLTACGTNTAYNQISSEVAVSSEAASNTESIISNAIKNELSVSNTSTLKTNTRDEMVYVFGKADGTQDHVTVTEKVTDANGDTTTNQSSSSKSAPVSMKVTYKLNGVETKPEDMIGKSGKVTIRYDYTNNEKKTIKVNGKSQTAYVPFTMITGTLLPTDKFSNVEVTNGKVSKVGDNIIALGMTMPGLKDTLNLKFDGESLDMDIPEYFEISADVNDFELDMSMSVATTSVLNDVDVDDFSLAKLEDKMNELQSAADQLTDGTVTLQDGTQTLADSIPALTDGVNQLNDGAGTLKNGIYAYTDGATALAAGAGQLKDGITAYTDGASKLSAGATQLKGGLSTYTAGVAQLADGSTQLKDGLSTYTAGVAAAASGTADLKSGINAYTTGAKNLGNGVAALKKGINDYTAGVTKAADGALQVSNGVSQLKKMLTEKMAADLKNNITAYKTNQNITTDVENLTKAAVQAGLSDITIADDLTVLAKTSETEKIEAKITEMYNKYLIAYTNSVVNNGAGSQLTGLYASQLGLLVKASGNQGAASALSQVATQLAASTDSLEALEKGAEDVSNGLNTLNSMNKTLNDGAAQINDGLVELNKNNDALNNGIASLDTGVSTLNSSNEKLNTGASQLQAGVVKLNENSKALNDGVAQIDSGLITLNANNSTLNGGIAQLYNGFATLNANNPALRDGSSQLADGTSTLKSSSATLADGVTQLNDGAITLKDGMAEFNASGIKAITSLVGNDADTAVDTIKEVIKLGKNYNSFLDKKDGKESSVTFIYKTAELTK